MSAAAPSSQSLIQRLAGIDLRSLAVFRIGLGVVLLWDLFTSLASAGALYSEAGMMPLAVAEQLRESAWIVSLHSLNGPAVWPVVLIVFQILAATCLIVGWRTQVAVAISWALLCSLQARNPVVLHGGGIVLRMLLFWSLLLPLGARWSVDEARGRRSFFAAEGRVFTVAALALLFQTAMIYWFTAALKWGNEWTRDGTAIYYALSANAFGFALRLDQYWALFAPKPLTEDGWLVLEATQREGTKIDLIREGRPVSYEKPALISAEFRDHKWQKMEINLYLAQHAKVRAPFCRHLAARWNARQPPDKQVVSWTLVYMKELTLPHGFAVRPQKVDLWRSDQPCGGPAALRKHRTENVN